MGEYVKTAERVSEQPISDYEQQRLAERQAVTNEFADTPMAYIASDGQTYTASGSYAVMAECGPMADESLDAEYLRYKFEEAAAFALQTQSENPEEEPKPDDELPLKEPEADKQTPAPKQEVFDQQHVAELHDSDTDEPKMDHLASQLTVSVHVAEVQREVAADQEPEHKEATQDQQKIETIESQAESVVQDSADRSVSSADPQKEATVEAVTLKPVIETQAQPEQSQVVVHEDRGGTEGMNGESTDPELVELPELSRQERVTRAVQEAIAIIERQDQHEEQPIEMLIEDLADKLPEPDVVGTEGMPVVEAMDYSDLEELQIEEVTDFELPSLADSAVIDQPDDIYETSEVFEAEDSETAEQLLDSGSEASDVIEHIEALTRMIEIEQASNEDDSDGEPNLEQANQDQPKEMAPEATVLPNELVLVLQEVGLAAPDLETTEHPTKLQEELVVVVKKIESLEKAVSAEACHEAAQELRSELAALLELFGYADSSAQADMLLSRWRYDLESLKQYIASLQKTIASMQSNTTKLHSTNTRPLHWHYGASAVRLVVNFAKTPLDQQYAAAA